ncbi:MAG: hypothetical protein SNJ85_06625 [Cyanobacteriota bacterium]
MGSLFVNFVESFVAQSWDPLNIQLEPFFPSREILPQASRDPP